MTETELWTYREPMTEPMDIKGFEVEASDGSIGKIDEATYDVGSSYIVVDTGPWIFGRRVVLPAGAIEMIDLDDRKVVRASHEGPDQGLAAVRRDEVGRHGPEVTSAPTTVR